MEARYRAAQQLPTRPAEVWNHLPRSVQETIIRKQIKVHTINAYAVAKEKQLGNRINTIMQTCFFAISNVLPRDEAIQKIKDSIKKTYGKRGEPVVRQNYAAVDAALAHLYEVTVPDAATSEFDLPPSVSPLAPDGVQRLTGEIIAGR